MKKLMLDVEASVVDGKASHGASGEASGNVNVPRGEHMTPNTTPTKQDMLAALRSPYYSMVFLGIASQAYTGQAKWADIQTGLYTAITDPLYTPRLPALGQAGFVSNGTSTPVTLPGNWVLDWGPANGKNGNGDNSNMLYICSYRAQGNSSHYKDGDPYFFAVGIRGTDIAANPLALFQQLMQDLKDFELYSWQKLMKGAFNEPVYGNMSAPQPNTTDSSKLTGKIAHGTMKGFCKIANSTAPLNNGQPPAKATGPAVTVIAALNALLKQYPDTPVVVTGHSLGGCLTQAMGAYLGWQLGPTSSGSKATVLPFAFAPPTAGDSDFIATYQAACPYGTFWPSDADLIPYAYIQTTDSGQAESGLTYAQDHLWTSYLWPAGSVWPLNPWTDISGKYGPTLPGDINDAITALAQLLPKTYVRPSVGVMQLSPQLPQPQAIAPLLLSMNCDASPTSPIAQLIWQHFPPAYTRQMQAQYGSVLVPYATRPYKVTRAATEDVPA